MDTTQLMVDRTENTVRLTLNRPDRLNAFNANMSQTLIRAFDDVANDDSIRVVVLTGAGRGFCAGQDLSDDGVAPGEHIVDLGATLDQHYIPLIERIAALPIPVIAAVNGVAAGAGASLALACDIVIASHTASFLQPFAKIGLLPDAGGTFFLPRAIGTPLALAFALTCDKLPAQRAYELGMIWKCVPAEDLESEIIRLSTQLASSAPLSLKAIKQTMRSAETRSLSETLRYERDLQRALGQTADYAEGVRAFGEKRNAVFVGH